MTHTAPTSSTRIPKAAGYLAASILVIACGIHAYWAAGGDWGAATAVGSTELPPQPVTAVVAILIGGAALLLLVRVGAIPVALPGWTLRFGPWALAGTFALAGVNNLIQPEDAYARDWHIYLFGPLLLTLAALCAVSGMSRPPAAASRSNAASLQRHPPAGRHGRRTER